MKPGESKQDKQTIRDEADAQSREAVRQTIIERERALRAVDEAASFAEREDTAAAASKTFLAKLRRFLGV